MRRAAVALLLSLAVAPHAAALADRGLIPLTPGVEVHEPDQVAVVAWSGGRELMILATNVRADGEAEVLEVLPLPSLPEVYEGSWDSLYEVVA
ncbi:MAG: DUF2330 domain-containing protein, partial [Thermoproteota archaeon]